MKTRLLFYNPGIRDRNIGVPEVQDVELETVCLAGDCIETPGTAYAVPKKVEANHDGQGIIGKYDYNKGMVAFVKANGEFHVTAQDDAVAKLEDAGYQKVTIRVPYTDGETEGDKRAEVLEHLAKNTKWRILE